MVRGYALYDFDSFKFGTICFVTQGPLWWMFHRCLKRNNILLLLGPVFYEYQIRSCWLMVFFSCSRCLLVFCVVVLSVAESGVLKEPTTVVHLPIYPFNFINFASHTFNFKLCCLVCTHLGWLYFLGGYILCHLYFSLLWSLLYLIVI